MKPYPITEKQIEIIKHIHKFRFLTSHQLQKLLRHKNPNRTLAWLKDLREKGYVNWLYERSSFIDNTKPAIYYLAPKARKILLDNNKIAPEELEYIYQEKRRVKVFIDHCITLADVYLYLLSQKDTQEELKLFTKNNLRGYDYFPDPMPDAFISIKGKETTRRYFLDIFEDFTPSFVLRNRVKQYLNHQDESDWNEKTNNEPLPTILFICPNQRIKKHVYKYAQSLLEKEYEGEISLFLTTKNKIYIDNNDIWEQVTVLDN